MTFSIYIEKLGFTGAEQVTLGVGECIVLVGPNNAGKSACLKDIANKFRDRDARGVVLSNLEISASATDGELRTWLQNNSQPTSDGQGGYHFQTAHAGLPEQHATQYWINRSKGLHALSPFFLQIVETANRLQLANPANSIRFPYERKTNPIHYL